MLLTCDSAIPISSQPQRPIEPKAAAKAALEISKCLSGKFLNRRNPM
jgi:hypothetical protein